MLFYQQLQYGFEPPLPLVVQYTPKREQGRAVDLGCGQGYNAVYAAEQGYSIDAVDGFQPGTMTSDYHEVLTKLAWYAHRFSLPITTHDQHIEDFLTETPANHYDLVIATHILHFDSCRGGLLYQVVMPDIVRVLKRGGRFIGAMLKSKQDKCNGYVEMIPKPLNAVISDLELESFWKDTLRPVHFDPAKCDDLTADGTSGDYQFCTWELVADKI